MLAEATTGAILEPVDEGVMDVEVAAPIVPSPVGKLPIGAVFSCSYMPYAIPTMSRVYAAHQDTKPLVGN